MLNNRIEDNRLQSMTYADRLSELSYIMNKENKAKTLIALKDQRYKTYLQWLKDNGAIFEDNLIYPIAYGPKGLIGLKAKRTINSNEAILFIPKKLMIISKEYESKYDLSEEYEDDRSSIILTLFLLEEKYEKGDKSFFKPYFDLIPEQDFCIFWNDDDLNELNCDYLVEDINSLKDDFQETYSQMPKEFKSKYTYKTFTMYFCHVLSRQFYIDDETSALVPFADALNHSSTKIKYEVFDSEHFVCKYTNDFSSDKHIITTSCKMYYNHRLNQKENNNIDDSTHCLSLCNLNEEIITLTHKDYFIISTNNQVFNEGHQVYNNYGCLTNKSFLKYYCFALLDNKYDSTKLSFSFQRGDYFFEKNMDVIFKKAFDKKINAFYNLLKIKVKKKEVCKDLLKYYRFMCFFDKKNMPMFFKYTFDYKIELSTLTKGIELLQKQLKEQSAKHSIDYDMTYLEKETMKDTYEDRKIVAVIFRLSQKISLAYQIDLLQTIVELVKKYKPKSYIELLDYTKEIDTISKYDCDNISLLRIKSFLTSPI